MDEGETDGMATVGHEALLGQHGDGAVGSLFGESCGRTSGGEWRRGDGASGELTESAEPWLSDAAVTKPVSPLFHRLKTLSSSLSSVCCILGGGLAGCQTALALADAFPATRLVLLEHQRGLLLGSSNATPGRMGLGFHYLLHPATAAMYLRETIGFIRTQLLDAHGSVQQRFIIGAPGSSLRKGRYLFITQPAAIARCRKHAQLVLTTLAARIAARADSDQIIRIQPLDANGDGASLATPLEAENAGGQDGFTSFGRQQILSRLDSVRQAYAQLVATDADNEVVGAVKDFYRVLADVELSAHVSPRLIDLAVETQESLLNWPEYRSHVLQQVTALESSGRLAVVRQREVIDVRVNSSDGYTVHSLDVNQGSAQPQAQRVIAANAVVNCTWHNVEWLSRSISATASVSTATTTRTDSTAPAAALSRASGVSTTEDTHAVVFTAPDHSTEAATLSGMSTRVKLLCRVRLCESMRSAPSMFFGLGAHCMFSNMGDGTGLMTFAPVTNAFCTQDIQLPADWAHRLQHGLSALEQQLYGQAILEGVALYLPAARDCAVLGCQAGVVKSRGAVDIFSLHSGHHGRAEHGVEQLQPGFVNNAAMKLFYAPSNAQLTVQALQPVLASAKLSQTAAALDSVQSHPQGTAFESNRAATVGPHTCRV